MPEQDPQWYTIALSTSLAPLKHLFSEEELTRALRTYGRVRRDFTGGYQVTLYWAGKNFVKGRQPYDGQIWRDDELLAEARAIGVRMLLKKLRAASAELNPPVEW